MKKVIRLKESDLRNIINRILSEQTKDNINPNNLKFGDGGRGNPDKVESVKQLQQKLMDLGLLKTTSMKPTGYFGSMTKNALDTYNGVKVSEPKKITPTPVIPKKETSNKPYTCISISKPECDRISSTSDTIISVGSEKACAKYMRKCLESYDKDFAGNAWTVLDNLKYRGVASEKYNMFTKNINWNGLWNDLKTNNINAKSCKCHEADHADPNCNTKIPEIVKKSYPSTTGFDISQLELGDIVGMYYNPSTNKGQAFCSRLTFDKKGDIVKTTPFEFNTHVGFVVAIKNGVPIILHNIGDEKAGMHHATPATKLLNKNGTMIAWVAKDNNVAQGIQDETPFGKMNKQMREKSKLKLGSNSQDPLGIKNFWK